ncbi:[methyl-Co(III) methanol-specific corrinoid protein]:coenzyme M methyltransferase [Desulfotomaculum arcticum]|uniref:[methyl-Co(III) methanol-specific corrinoid protein]:coenzyme M methyltransferase n=1 Tax=Desulfotruncus arcticus DSM 17038 TaxID=1121424 RepID=A0A1I2QEP5_9FIRM|nr:uroporphyrinogen decarboxylase family protein [Desulfotruncus arcticus]SFG24061.1 [methyl-Co(III) methanol-specific corrinoid protein]:coenzyme M methyltransferase [Desulfotomaculum arcticum] [Desulfotruncus arcticus DSM 17038]
MNSKERVLNILTNKDADRMACFSGMGSVLTASLEEHGYKFPTVHGDAVKMAKTAAYTYRATGMESVVVPYDMCVDAEALGCVMNAYEDVNQLLYPTIKEKIIHNEEEMKTLTIPDKVWEKGRYPVVLEALNLLKNDVGNEAAVCGWLLGPFTMAGQIMDLNDLFKLVFKKPDLVNGMLEVLTDLVITMAAKFREAGADYICIREMGATTDVLSPRNFKQVIDPHLERIFANIGSPNVLHICGSTNIVMKNMLASGADAISVEIKNNLQKSREDIGYDPLIFGNIDAYSVLVLGTPDDVAQATINAMEASVDSVWPSCDIWPEAPVANVKAMVDTVKQYGAEKWVRKNK